MKTGHSFFLQISVTLVADRAEPRPAFLAPWTKGKEKTLPLGLSLFDSTCKQVFENSTTISSCSS